MKVVFGPQLCFCEHHPPTTPRHGFFKGHAALVCRSCCISCFFSFFFFAAECCSSTLPNPASLPVYFLFVFVFFTSLSTSRCTLILLYSHLTSSLPFQYPLALPGPCLCLSRLAFFSLAPFLGRAANGLVVACCLLPLLLLFAFALSWVCRRCLVRSHPSLIFFPPNSHWPIVCSHCSIRSVILCILFPRRCFQSRLPIRTPFCPVRYLSDT